MGIRFYCPNGHRLHVKSFLAGKRGICPHCAARFRIPPDSEIPRGAPKLRPNSAAASASGGNGRRTAAPTVTASTPQSPTGTTAPLGAASAMAVSSRSGVVPADPIDEAPEAIWYVRPPSGGQYGPAKGDVMRRWIEEGRVSADSLVWREGWTDWQTAGPVFPALGSSYTSPAAAPLKREPVSLQLQPAASAALTPARPASSASRSGPKTKSIAAVVILVVAVVALMAVLIVVLTTKG